MAEHQPRSSDEAERLPYTKTAVRRAVRMTIGQELKAHYKVLPDLPHIGRIDRTRRTHQRQRPSQREAF